MFLDADEQEEQEVAAPQNSSSVGADSATLGLDDSTDGANTAPDAISGASEVEQEA